MSLCDPELNVPWDLGDEWIELEYNDYNLIILQSGCFHGSLRQVSKRIGGRPMGFKDFRLGGDPKSIIYLGLVGCFVGVELRPRFLGTFNSQGRGLLYTNEASIIDGIGIIEILHIPDIDFKSNLMNLKTRLWRV